MRKTIPYRPYLIVKLNLAGLFQVPSNIQELPLGAQEGTHWGPHHKGQSDQLMCQVVAVTVVQA